MDYLPLLLEGVGQTVLVTVAGFGIGAVLGLPLAFARMSRLTLLRVLSRFAIDIVRSVPTIVWLFLLYYALAQDVVSLRPLTAAIVTIGMIATAFMAENYRGGFLSVDPGQWEAAQALGLSRWETVRRIILPQAIVVTIPPASTLAIGLLKESAVTSVIGVQDVTFEAFQEVQRNLDGLGVYSTAALVYIALSVPVAVASRWTYKVLSRRVAV